MFSKILAPFAWALEFLIILAGLAVVSGLLRVACWFDNHWAGMVLLGLLALVGAAFAFVISKSLLVLLVALLAEFIAYLIVFFVGETVAGVVFRASIWMLSSVLGWLLIAVCGIAYGSWRQRMPYLSPWLVKKLLASRLGRDLAKKAAG